ncbi:TPA: cell wall anchor protein [Streptococcus agalactiae]
MKITLTIIFIVFIAIFGFAGAVWIGFKDNIKKVFNLFQKEK